MPSWFKKVFRDDAAKPAPIPEAAPTATAPQPAVQPVAPEPNITDMEGGAKIRKLISAPVIVSEEERSSWSEEIRIKARVDQDGAVCTFMIDRPVLEGLSAWFPEKIWAKDVCSLAEQLFEIKGVGTVMLHDTTVTVTYAKGSLSDWEELAQKIGSAIRDNLKSDTKVIIDDFRESIPPEDEIRQKLQDCLDLEINPGIAAHSGVITLERVDGNTIYITMGGGCQGCAASTITLRHGIHTVFRKAVPQIGAICDETDHASGTNPYFKELPASMA